MDEARYTRVYRLIHWAIAITFLLLLVTIFLRLTWMNKDHMAAIIQDYLSSIHASLTQEQTIALAKKIRKPMWAWHLYLGYVLTGLFSIRFLLPLIGSMKFQNPFDQNLTPRLKFKNWSYLVFYLCVATSLTTGLLMVFGPEKWGKTMESVHVLGIYYLIAFLVVHLVGVFTAEFTHQKGIVSAVISGIKRTYDQMD